MYDTMRDERKRVAQVRLVAVALELLGAQSAEQRRENARQTALVDERNDHQRLPVLRLAVHVRLEISRIEVDDRRGRLEHQQLHVEREQLAAQWREYCHQLFEWRKRLACSKWIGVGI